MNASTTVGLPEPRTIRSDLVKIAGAGVLWGTGGLAGALLGSGAALSPLAVAAYRLLVGGLVLVAVLAALGRLRGIRRDGAALRRLVAIGLLAAVYQSCYFGAVALTTVSLATLVTLGTAPVLVVAAEAVLTRRRPSAALLVAVGTAVAGLLLLVGTPGDGQDPATVVLGCALALCSAAGFAAITLLGRRPVPGLDPVSSVGLAFTLGGAVLLVAAVPLGLGFAATAGSLALVAYLGVAPTALAYVLYFGGLRTVRSGPAALIALLEPLTAAVLGALVLSDRLGVAGTLGGLLIGVAVLLSRRE